MIADGRACTSLLCSPGRVITPCKFLGRPTPIGQSAERRNRPFSAAQQAGGRFSTRRNAIRNVTGSEKHRGLALFFLGGDRRRYQHRCDRLDPQRLGLQHVAAPTDKQRPHQEDEQHTSGLLHDETLRMSWVLGWTVPRGLPLIGQRWFFCTRTCACRRVPAISFQEAGTTYP